MMTKPQKKILFLSSLGGVLEFYDFIIYALLASYISNAFFPTGSPITSLIVTFATFSVGYLVRPIGGVLFGHFGDRFGRKKTFTFSILMMAVATFCIGLVPTYASIGLAAPIILTVLRILQGLSVGGEIPGAIAYVSESIPEKKGFACGVIFCSILNGIVIGSLLQAIHSYYFTPQQMQNWGWRLPFFIGGIFGFFSYIFRRQLEESALFRAIEDQVVAFPIIKVFHTNFINALAGLFIVGLGASITTLLFLFTPAYLTEVVHVPESVYAVYIWYKTAAIFLATLLCILFGLLSDRVNHKFLVIILCILVMVCIYPIFDIYANHFSDYIIGLLLSALISGFAWGVIPNLLADLFPTEIRYSGIGLSYNLGFAVFAGLTPLIAMFLIYEIGWVVAPIFYLIGTAGLALLSLLFIKLSSVK